MQVRVRVTALVLASHPVPCAAVTAMSAALFASAGNPAVRCVIGSAAVLAGQLSIGWSNDLIDAQRDRRAGRTDKPLAKPLATPSARPLAPPSAAPSARPLARPSTAPSAEPLTPPSAGDADLARQARVAVVIALLATVVLSLLLGWRAALLHYAAVACAWAYNLGLKGRSYSPLPFFLAFGSLPAIATLALPEPRWPPAWTMVAAGLLGVAAHFCNVVPDIPDDLAVGVLGLPQRVGARGSVLAAAAAIVLATAIIVLIGPSERPAVSVAGAVLVIGLVAVAIAAAVRDPRGRAPFMATMAAAAIDVVILAANHGLG